MGGRVGGRTAWRMVACCLLVSLTEVNLGHQVGCMKATDELLPQATLLHRGESLTVRHTRWVDGCVLPLGSWVDDSVTTNVFSERAHAENASHWSIASPCYACS